MKTIKKIMILALAIFLAIPIITLNTNAEDTVTLSYDVTWLMSDARKELDLINQFRTGSDAWYWNSDNSTKTVCSSLSGLIWDYNLEKVAMQRCVEVAISYSHTRPNNSSCFTAYNEAGYSWSAVGENIAAGYTSYDSVVKGWREDNEDYDGQGHRRNLLSSNFRYVACAGCYFNGTYYWVQEFANSSTPSTSFVAAVDGVQTVSSIVALSNITSISITSANSSIEVTEGNTTAIPAMTTSVKLANTWSQRGKAFTVNNACQYAVADSSIASLSGTTITGKKAGTTSLTVSNLGKSTTVPITVKSKECTHNYASTITKQPTCTAEGVRTYTCSLCGSSYTEVIAKVAHTIVNDPAIAATCTTSGKTAGTHCSVCGQIITAQKSVAALGHSYTSKITKQSTCTTEGVRTYICSLCGSSYTEAIAKVAHTIVNDPAIAATCTTSGKTAGTHCSVCGQIITAQKSVAALGHSYTSTVAAPTSTEMGYTLHTCTRCGDAYKDNYTDATGSLSVSIAPGVLTVKTGESKDITLTVNGNYAYSYYPDCETNNDNVQLKWGSWNNGSIKLTVTGKAIGTAVVTIYLKNEDTNAIITSTNFDVTIECGHRYTSKITKQPTCISEGTKVYTCSICGNTYTETIAKTDHTAVVDKAVAATCTSSGLTAGSHCSVCGEVITTQYVVAALGHSFTTTVIAPTSTAQGYTLYTCTRCGESYKDNYTEPTGIKLPFTDVPEGKWYCPYIAEAYTLNLMTGKTETTFDPTANMTRGQVATVLYRMAGEPEVSYDGHFSDVPDGKFFSKAVTWAYQNGVVKGKTATTFDPSANITRQELAIMLKRYVQSCGIDVSQMDDLSGFADSSNVSGYAKDSMQWAVANGIIGGKTREGKLYLDPKANATRAECCKMLLVAYHLIHD